ncbi:hypothetical protein N7478_002676 [Penicillium angulare]|uniref:uncharacterized protein n=1 Tax=Penicillium angulare TaxID=116970 RepID=UPI002540AB44|nr:uncharacterized protein N7478_002676 [Penicillium angulare]KAJ5286990.1 hypothetical protein N7478_002676 [Penicillium angulare]
MRTSFLLTAAIAAFGVNADDSTTTTTTNTATATTLPYFSPSWDWHMITHGRGISKTAASIADVKSQTTTYHVGCQKGVPTGECSFPNSWTIVQGADTANFKAEYVATTSDESSSWDVTITQTYDCSLHHSTESASCSMSASMSGTIDGEKSKSSTSTKMKYKSAPMGTSTGSYFALLVTAGLESTTNSKATETAAAASGKSGAMITAAPMVAAAVAAML